MNKQDVKIEVYAYSTFADGITIPNFESVFCDGGTSTRHFISGYGIVKECGSNTQMLRNAYVAFCGFSDNELGQYAITSVNNIVKLDNNILVYAHTGYVAYLINVIKSIQISVGDTVLIAVKDKNIQLLIEALVDFCGAKTTSVINTGANIDKVICDNYTSFDAESISNYAHIAHIGALESVPTIKHQEVVAVTTLGELSDISDYAVNGRMFPKHYVLNSFSKNIETAIFAINHILHQNPTIFTKFDSHILQNIVSDITLTTPTTAKCDYDDQIKRIHALFSERIDSCLINIMVLSNDIEASWNQTMQLAKYIVNDESLTFSISQSDEYINAVAKIKKGSVVHCVISKSKLHKNIIEMHFDGQSVVLNNGHCTLYQQTKISVI